MQVKLKKEDFQAMAAMPLPTCRKKPADSSPAKNPTQNE